MIGEKLQKLFFKDIPESLTGVSSAYKEYYKAVTYEKLVIILSGVSILALLFVVGNLFFLFVAVGLALIIGQWVGSFALGFMILGGVYLLIGIAVYLLRKPLIINPVVKVLQTLLYSEEGVFDKLVNVEEEKGDE